VSAPGDREAAWVFACRSDDLPYWVDRELWLIQLAGPVREARRRDLVPRARLAARIEAWSPEVHRRYAVACARHARDLALPALPAGLSDRIARLDDPVALAAAMHAAPEPSAVAGYLGDTAALAGKGDPAAASYLACLVAGAVRGDAAGFHAERAWQARWLSEQLALDRPAGA
jgi:hypothetical protein